MVSQPAAMRSASSSSTVKAWEKLVYNAKLLARRLAGPDHRRLARVTFDEVCETVALYEQETGRRAGEARVLEIGFGPRPYRAYAMANVFGAVQAIDLDQPAFTLGQVLETWRKNGAERALKTFVRLALFDLRQIPRVRAELAALSGGRSGAPDLIQGDAADPAFWAGKESSLDLIVSDDVFEHIPADNLASIVSGMQRALKPGGLAIIRPFVFHGVSGGHDIEAYPENLRKLPPDKAWRHLWDSSFRVNTYLNRLSRRDFREIFETGFVVSRDVSMMPDLGRRLMTEDVRSKIKEFDDYELFSNKVEFVLKPKLTPGIA